MISLKLRPLSLFGILTVLLLGGCATIQTLDLDRYRNNLGASRRLAPTIVYRGVFHVHSRYSHDSKGSFDLIAHSARRAGLDFVIVTDHNTLAGVKEEGEKRGVLMIVGEEISTEAGHLIALGIRKPVSRVLPVREIMKKIEAEEGFGVLAHPLGERAPWRDLSMEGFQGIEIYNLAEDIYDENPLLLGFKLILFPPSRFYRSVFDSPREALVLWDELNGKGDALESQPVPFSKVPKKIFAIGAVDAHHKFRILGKPFDHYEAMFRMVSLYVQAGEKSRDAILEGIRGGRFHIAFERWGKAREFYFQGTIEEDGEKKSVSMGDAVSQGSALRLWVRAPEAARMRVTRDGGLIFDAMSKQWESGNLEKGVYRVEMWKGRRLWIVSNPIWVE